MVTGQSKQFGGHTIDNSIVKNSDTACKTDVFNNPDPTSR